MPGEEWSFLVLDDVDFVGDFIDEARLVTAAFGDFVWDLELEGSGLDEALQLTEAELVELVPFGI